MSAVHGHEVDVDVDDQVGLGGPSVDLNDLRVVGLAQLDVPVGVLGVMIAKMVGPEPLEDARPDNVLEFSRGQPAVQADCADQPDSSRLL